MIATISIKVNAAKPNFPLQPIFAFKGSPSSLRLLEVPKAIGKWSITSVKVVMTCPDNTTIEKTAVRTGSVWVATLEGCATAGKVIGGYEVLADGIDEDGNEVTGYVLGKGDTFILDDDTEAARLVGKVAVRYMDELPDEPTAGDLLNANGELRLFDGENWISLGGNEQATVNDSQITIKKNGTTVGTFTVNSAEPKTIDIPIPSTTSDILNDSGFITVSAIPTDISSFENDVGYITESAIPTNVGAFNNDAGYITESAIPSTVSSFENDAGYITASVVPTKVSELENDSGFITASAIPSTISSFENDSGYITESAIPSNVGAFANDVGYLTSVSWGDVGDKPDVALTSDIPSNVSELVNDSGYITASSLPTKVSELENDSGYLSAVSWGIVTDKPAIPSSTSDLVNDSGFITLEDVPPVPSNLSDYNNDVGFITMSAVPSKVSELTNDTGFITASQVPPAPSKVSELQNDTGFITMSAVPSKVSELDNDTGFITASAIPAIPSKTSELDNDSGFITASVVPTKVSELDNDLGFMSAVTWSDVTGKPNIPSNTTDLNNDSGFITASAIPSNVGAFVNDVGYITQSQATPSYIQDYDANRIDAGLGAMQITGGDELAQVSMSAQTWDVVGTYEGNPINTTLSYAGHDNLWTDGTHRLEYFEVYPSDWAWVWDIDYGITGDTTDEYASHIAFDFTTVSLVATRRAQVTLATRSWVEAQIGQALTQQL